MKAINWSLKVAWQNNDSKPPTCVSEDIVKIPNELAQAIDDFITELEKEKNIDYAYNKLETEIVRLKSLLKGKDLDLKSAEEVRLSHAKKIAHLQAELRKRGKSNDSK